MIINTNTKTFFGSTSNKSTMPRVHATLLRAVVLLVVIMTSLFATTLSRLPTILSHDGHGLRLAALLQMPSSSSFSYLESPFTLVVAQVTYTTGLISIPANGTLPAYQSEYAVICPAGPGISWTDARAACAARGPEWGFASVASAVVEAALMATTTSRIWIGGSDAATDDDWRWVAGRLRNLTFYRGRRAAAGGACIVPPCACELGMYCNWHPTNPDGSGAGEDSVHIHDPAVPGRQWNDWAASAIIACYACERSPCSITADCNAANTLSVNTSHYFTPSGFCGCVCKDGFSGPRCDDVAPVVTVGTYQSQFAVMCTAVGISWTDARAACAARGPAWGFASVASATVEAALMATTTSRIWIGGSDAATDDDWRWVAGRLRNLTFYRGRRAPSGGACVVPPCSCELGMYCNWHPDNPSGSGAGEDSVHIHDPAVPGRQWNDWAASAIIACYACERSPCSITADCNAANTLSVNSSHYYTTPTAFCGCVCKDGFSGPRCDDIAPVVTVGAYQAQYGVQCASRPVTWTEAGARCRTRGPGWDIASVPTAAAQAAIAAPSPDYTWLGGSDLMTDSVWVWAGGRLKNTTFFRGTSVIGSAACAVPPCACEPGMYCHWDVGQPNNNSIGGEFAAHLLQASTNPLREWNDAPDVDVLISCYACERSPCSITADCNAANTLSVNTSHYFTPGAYCGCVCKDWFMGPRCDDVNASASTTTTATTTIVATTTVAATTTTKVTTATTGTGGGATTTDVSTSASPPPTTTAIPTTTLADTTTTDTTSPVATASATDTSAAQTTSTTTIAATATGGVVTTTGASSSTAADITSSSQAGTSGPTSTNVNPSAPTTTATTTGSSTASSSCPVGFDGGQQFVSTVMVDGTTLQQQQQQRGGSTSITLTWRFVPGTLAPAAAIQPAWVPALPSALFLISAGAACTASADGALLQCVLTVNEAATGQQTSTSTTLHDWHLPPSLLNPACAAAASSGSSLSSSSIVARLVIAPVSSGSEDAGAALAVAVVAVAGLSTSAAFFIGDPTAMEVHAAAVVLLGPCATPADRTAAAPARYLLSPVADAGPAVVVAAHVGVSAAFLVGHAAVTAVLATRRHHDQSQSPLTTMAALLRFPSVSFAVAALLYPGVARAAAQLIAPDTTADGVSTAVRIAALTIAVIFLIALPVVGALALRRHARHLQHHYQADAHSAVFHQTPARLRQASLWAWLTHADGQWGPDDTERSLGMLRGFGGPRGTHILIPAGCLFITVAWLSTAAGRGPSCASRHWALAALLAAAAVAIALRRPYRHVLTNAFTAAANAAAALLCAGISLQFQQDTSANTNTSSSMATKVVTAGAALVMGITILRTLHWAAVRIREAREINATTTESNDDDREMTGSPPHAMDAGLLMPQP